ncbi:peptide-methionine (R)-S-oxide reductase MsrB [Sinorhizobium terangae]|uniref:peptide-methionine (R)-S-oxide reductase MsrB n=1 Tax=Sinorhizobium terangae TaxID=110322 RepID=UPI003D15F6D3
MREVGTEYPFAEPYPIMRNGRRRYTGLSQPGILFLRYEIPFRWSYFAPIDERTIKEYVDRTHFMVRTEIRCALRDAISAMFPGRPRRQASRCCFDGTPYLRRGLTARDGSSAMSASAAFVRCVEHAALLLLQDR